MRLGLNALKTSITSTAAAGAVPLGASAGWAKDTSIRFAVPDHPPTRIMQDLANERYHAPSGNNIRLEIDFIPWPNYYERLAASLASGEQKYQMIISDSQWLGAFVEGGYYMKINEFIDADPELRAIFGDLHPNLIAAYSTYPYGSDSYYGFPQNPEILTVFYRKDLFCDEGEQASFRKRYGYKLPCTSEEMNDVDWNAVRDFGAFFRRERGEHSPAKRWPTSSMALPIRPQKPTTTPSCRSTPSSGSTVGMSGTKPKRRMAKRRASSTRMSR